MLLQKGKRFHFNFQNMRMPGKYQISDLISPYGLKGKVKPNNALSRCHFPQFLLGDCKRHYKNGNTEPPPPVPHLGPWAREE